jgi:tetratricopeptide (TPR) repeat protein
MMRLYVALWDWHGAAMKRLGLGLVVFLLLAHTPSSAGDLRSMNAAYDRGAFADAAKAGEARGDAPGLSLAARALIAEAVTGDASQSHALLQRAIVCARTAIAADPESVEARLHWAVALGMQGRRMSLSEAARKGYAGKGRKLIDQALALDPNEPWAHALSGGWHLEVLRRGGAMGATLYGARLSEGLAAFDRALALAPDDGAMAYQIAVSLLDYDAERYADRAGALLDTIHDWTPEDAFEQRVKAQAERVRSILVTRGPEAAARVAVGRFS